MDNSTDNSSLCNAWRIQEDAALLGFDWPDIQGVLDKIEEELEEIREALAAGDVTHARIELGDLLLASVNAARFLSVKPACALDDAAARFEDRFQLVKNHVEASDRSWENYSLEELETLWQRLKKVADKKRDKRVDKGGVNQANCTLPIRE